MKSRYLLALASLFFGLQTSTALAVNVNAPGCPGSNMRSSPSNHRVNVTFQNKSRKLQSIHWVDFNGRTKFYRSLFAGRSYTVQSYSSHVWIVWEGSNNGRCNYWISLPPEDQTVTIR